jgi:hydrogenase/urease accessory protein HupE
MPAAWLAAGVAGHLSPAALLPMGVTSLSLLLFGILTAADPMHAPTVLTVLAAVLGIMHGWLNGAGIVVASREASGLVGITAATFVLAALLSALVISLHRPWTRIAVHVAGSWIAAIGLLLLGWSLRAA